MEEAAARHPSRLRSSVVESAGTARPKGGDFAAEALPHLDRIHMLARRVARPPLDAEELTQETYTRAFAAYHQFTPGSDMRAWLTTILLNLARGAGRRRAPEVVSLETCSLSAVAGDAAPERDAIVHIQHDAVLAAIDALPDEFRITIALVDLAGLRTRDAAAALDVPVGTVLSRLSRGRARLARSLRREIGGLDAV